MTDSKRVRMNVDNSRRAPTIGNIYSRLNRGKSRGTQEAKWVNVGIVCVCLYVIMISLLVREWRGYDLWISLKLKIEFHAFRRCANDEGAWSGRNVDHECVTGTSVELMRWRAGCDIAEYVDSAREFVYRNFFSFLSYLTSLLWPTRLLFLVRPLMLWACGSWVFTWIPWDSVLPNYYATKRSSVVNGFCAPCVIGVRLK